MPELNWLGDRKAKQAARQVPYRLLQPVEHVGDPASDNLLIQGDNLDALKSLLPLYAGRVKCIFIDPPYNTKSAFEHYDDNLEHSQWLSMMYPRLELLRELLAEDGSIWVTIDDNEGHYLKVMMDEVFHRGNFVVNIVWQKRTSRENRAAIGSAHDHVLLYAKSGAIAWKDSRNLLPSNDGGYSNPDNDPRGDWRSIPFSAQGHRPNQMYRIPTPTGDWLDPPKGRCWGATEPVFQSYLDDNRVYFPKAGAGRPRIKQFRGEEKGLVPMTWWAAEFAGDNEAAKKEALALSMNDEAFGTPKPEELLWRILTIATNPGDLVLDSFLGSGTTAAVAHKMGRRWIGIEMGEHARTHCLPRLTKVVEGEQGGISAAVNWQGGGGFRFMRLGEPVFEQDGRISPSVRFAPLAAYLWFVETRMPWDEGHGQTSPRPSPGEAKAASPLLGVHGETAIVLLYNGILGDRRPQGGNVLTHAVWDHIRSLLPDHTGPWLVYGEASRLQPATLRKCGIEFRQIPYDIKLR